MKAKSFSIIILAFLVLFCFAGCGKRFNGVYFGSDCSLEFVADGTCLFRDNNGFNRGKYKWDDNDGCYYVTVNFDTYSVTFHPDYDDKVIIVNGGEFENATFSITGSQTALNEYAMGKQMNGY